jgi:hypothetical protein
MITVLLHGSLLPFRLPLLTKERVGVRSRAINLRLAPSLVRRGKNR